MHCPNCQAPVAKSDFRHHKFSCRSCSKRIWRKRRPGFFHWLVLILPIVSLVTFGVLNFVERNTGESEHYQGKNEFSVYGFPFVAKKKRAEFEKNYSTGAYDKTHSNVTYTDVPESLYSNIGVALATTILSWLGVLSVLRMAWYRHHFHVPSSAEEFSEEDLGESKMAEVRPPPVRTTPKPKFSSPEIVPNSSQRRMMSIGAFCIGCAGVLLCFYVGASLARTLAEMADLIRSGNRGLLLGFGAVGFLVFLLEVLGRIFCVMTPNKGERLSAATTLFLLFVLAAGSIASVLLAGNSEDVYQFGSILTGVLSVVSAVLFWFFSVDYARKVAEHGRGKNVMDLADEAGAAIWAAVVAVVLGFVSVIAILYFIGKMVEVSNRAWYSMATVGGVQFIVSAVMLIAIASHSRLYFQLARFLNPRSRK